MVTRVTISPLPFWEGDDDSDENEELAKIEQSKPMSYRTTKVKFITRPINPGNLAEQKNPPPPLPRPAEAPPPPLPTATS